MKQKDNNKTNKVDVKDIYEEKSIWFIFTFIAFYVFMISTVLRG